MNSKKGNIITFPKHNGKLPPSQEEIDDNIDYLINNHIDEAIDFIAPELFQSLKILGFDFDDEDTKLGAFVIESIKSLLCNHYGALHPFQELAEKTFDEVDGDMRIVDSINIIFSKSTNEKEELEI